MSADTDRRPAPDLVEFSRRQRAISWAWLAITTSLVLGAIIFANLLAHRRGERWDLTRDRIYSIEPGTREQLAKLKHDVQIRMTFLESGMVGPGPGIEDKSLPVAWQQLKNTLEAFQEANPGKITVEAAEREGDQVLDRIRQDFDKQVSANMVYIVTRQGDRPPQKRAISMRELYEGDPATGAIRTFVAESRIASALSQMDSGVARTAYYTVGHGELQPGQGEAGGISVLTRYLDNWLNIRCKPLDLPSAERIPPDCSVLIIAGLSRDLEEQELRVLREYLDLGGDLFVAMDIGAGRRLSHLLEDWGVRCGMDFVADPSDRSVRDPLIIRVRRFGEHEINAGMNNVHFLMPGTRTVEPSPGTHPRRRAFALMYAGPESWAQPVERQEPRPMPDDPRGPSIAACAETMVKDAAGQPAVARIVVWGSPVAMSNVNLLLPGSMVREDYVGYVLNNVRWLVDLESGITAPPVRLSSTPLELSGTRERVLFFVTVVAMPLVGVILGALAWFFRRK